jgi:hypothetical protein
VRTDRPLSEVVDDVLRFLDGRLSDMDDAAAAETIDSRILAVGPVTLAARAQAGRVRAS